MIELMFYTGGWWAAYSLHRRRCQGRLSSAFDATLWPVGLGHHICRVFYDSTWSEK